MINASVKEILGDLTEFEKKHAPNEIFYAGDLNLLHQGRRVSVVGSRKVSKEGGIRAKVITKKLVEMGFVVVSGLAQGVDTVAHYTTISLSGKTISVLGTPLNETYPKSNESLLKEIKKNHLAISQFPEGFPTRPQNFPMRNRTMALISDATIIVEASEKSGTKHQGWEALRLNREVFILQNIVEDPSISWAKEMIEYGAHILTKENMELSFLEIPHLTSRKDFAF